MLYDFNADVILNGHDHIYERFAPQNPNGVADPARGIREFVVGTGGKNHSDVGPSVANSQVREEDTFGVLSNATPDEMIGSLSLAAKRSPTPGRGVVTMLRLSSHRRISQPIRLRPRGLRPRHRGFADTDGQADCHFSPCHYSRRCAGKRRPSQYQLGRYDHAAC
jgi:hypothetical protein